MKLETKQLNSKINQKMKTQTILAVAMGFTLSAASSHATIALGFSSLANQDIQFQGSTFSLTPGTGSIATPQFAINSDSGGNGSGLGLTGWINGSPWTIGPVTTVAPGLQTASVTGGSGVLSIYDGAGNTLTGAIQWVSLSSYQASGAINQNATVNISGLSYSGLNSDLLHLVAQGTGNGIATLAYTWTSSHSLSDLVCGPTYTDNYTGQLTPVPEPSTMAAGALLLLPFGASTLRVLRKNRMA